MARTIVSTATIGLVIVVATACHAQIEAVEAGSAAAARQLDEYSRQLAEDERKYNESKVIKATETKTPSKLIGNLISSTRPEVSRLNCSL